MQISDAVEVFEVRSQSEANAKLKEGWSLLAVLPGATGGNGSTYVIYVLGKPKTKADPMEGLALGQHVTAG